MHAAGLDGAPMSGTVLQEAPSVSGSRLSISGKCSPFNRVAAHNKWLSRVSDRQCSLLQSKSKLRLLNSMSESKPKNHGFFVGNMPVNPICQKFLLFV
ncbi:hypothetical protein CEXT_281201 [Caerostris extrusa]|uniref:Uncharacterized protein n=1 Tax=Caerostris extrusa TaxID=172846 RepID=A0AAV4Y0D6_CAEEX|nr:hypothetical protein CEXT_281201 [Caerostris extrusa]